MSSGPVVHETRAVAKATRAKPPQGLWDRIKSAFGSVTHSIKAGVDHAFYGLSTERFKSRRIEWDPSDVNRPRKQEVSEAGKELATYAQVESEKLASWSEADRARFKQVEALGDPMARRALQAMVIDGRLPGSEALGGKGRLLDQLATLATQPLAPGIDRGELVSQTISEIETPVRIDQMGKGTCVATTAQILLARKNPAEYVRLVAGLASPEGKVKLAGGDTIHRHADWADGSDDGRSTPSRLLQPALMDDGEMLKPIAGYDNTKDTAKVGPISLGGGLSPWGGAHLNSQLEGKAYHSHLFMRWNRDAQWDRVKAALEAGKGPLPVGVNWQGDGGHELQIDRISGGRVYYTNPWGQTESMDEAEFKSHIKHAEIPA